MKEKNPIVYIDNIIQEGVLRRLIFIQTS